MVKNSFCFFICLLVALFGLTACGEGQIINDNGGNNFIETTEGGNVEFYRIAIDKNKSFFTVSLNRQYSEPNGSDMTRADIKNISEKIFYEVGLQVIFTDEAGNVQEKVLAGIYNQIKPQEVVNYYLRDSDNQLALGYVIDIREKWFS